MISGLTDTQREREREREYREWSRNTNKHNPLEAYPCRTHTQRKKTYPSSRARRGYSGDPSLILTDPSYSSDPFLIVTNPMNDPPLSQSDCHEQPTPELICPPCEQPTPRLNHLASDPFLDRAATFRSTHCVHVATTVATTKSLTNRSLSLSLSLNLSLCLTWLVLWF